MRPYLLLLRQLTIFSVGVIIVLAPWIWRNYQKSGLIYLNEPYFRFGIILQRFNPDLIPTPTPNPIRDDNGSQLEPSHPNQINSSQNQAFSFSVAYPLRNLLSITPQVRLHNEKPGPSPTATPMPPQATSTTEVETIAKDYLNKALQNKSEFFLYMLAHYFNSQIQFLLMLPSTFRGFDAFTTFLGNRSVQKLWYDCCSTIGYTRRLPYWPKWQGDLALQSSVPLVLNIFILAVGVQTSWRRQRWLGILPLLCAMIYIAANAFFRNSGGRYLLPVDWVVIVYFSIGTIQIIISLTDYFFEKKFLDHLPMEQSRSGNSSSKMGIIWKSLILAAGFMIISISVPLTERVFPNLYPQERQAQMLATLLDAKKLTPKQQGMLKSFIDQGAAVQAGRILYPQFYPSGVGSLGKEDSPIDPLPFPRLVFNIVSSQSNLVTLPMENKAPIVPNASDGLLISCPDGAPIALAIFDKADRLQSAIFTSPEPNDYSCPLTLPSDSTP